MHDFQMSIPGKDAERKRILSVTEEKKCYIPARYVLTLLGFLGMFNIYAMRVNLSVAMVAMVNRTVDSSENATPAFVECPMLVDEEDQTQDQSFKGDQYFWDPKTQSDILGSFFYGYVLTQLPGGTFGEKFGAKWLFGGGVFVTAFFSLLTPLAASLGVSAFIAVRVLEGLGEGVTFPAMNSVISRWSPKFERSRVSTIIFTGSQIGNVIAMPISGWLCSTDLLGGWPSVFYVFGAVGCVWFFFWSILVHENPAAHPRISLEELRYIQGDKEVETNKKKPAVPWRKIATSLPVWAVIVAHVGHNFGFLILLTELPSYFGSILHFDIQSNGLLSALPYIVQALTAWLASYVADRLRKSGRLRITTIRKIFNTIGLVGPALCFLGVTVSGCRPMLIVAFISLAMAMNGCIYSGFNVTHVDMSPDFAGTLLGITNAISNICGIGCPALVGYFTRERGTIANWNKVFYITAAVYVLAAVFYDLFCSAELQPWGVGSQNSTDVPQNDTKKELEEIKS